jgi:hypothetical protein
MNWFRFVAFGVDGISLGLSMTMSAPHKIVICCDILEKKIDEIKIHILQFLMVEGLI